MNVTDSSRTAWIQIRDIHALSEVDYLYDILYQLDGSTTQPNLVLTRATGAELSRSERNALRKIDF